MHLRMPSIDQGVQSFVWAVVFFVILWLGMLAVGVSSAHGADPLARRERRDLPLRAPARRRPARAS